MELFNVRVSEVTDGKRSLAETKEYRVLALSAERAIKRVRTEVVGKTWDWEDDKGKKRVAKITKIDVLSVEHGRRVDFW